MAKIFISYRREDSAYVASMLSEKLTEYFGQDAVFIDVDHIPLGVDFRKKIDTAIKQCNLVLIIIGDTWLTTQSVEGHRRIDDPSDFVRIEIEAALNREIPVIPILIDDVKMPSEEELPASINALAYRNAAELRSGRDLRHHIEELIVGLREIIETSEEAGSYAASNSIAEPVSNSPQPARKVNQTAVQVVLKVLAVFLVLLVFGGLDQLIGYLLFYELDYRGSMLNILTLIIWLSGFVMAYYVWRRLE